MYCKTLLVAVAGFALARAVQDAEITQHNPDTVVYQAILEVTNSSSIGGYIAGTGGANGTGIQFNINFFGFSDMSLGPFLYHIHENPVPADGNCTGTGAHLDPENRGESPPCDPTTPQQCQVGDLAGKHGNITTTPFQTTYPDLYVSSLVDVNSFYGDRSIVIHSSNLTRLACANFTLIAGQATSSANSTTTASAPASTSSKASAAATKYISGGAVMAGLLAFLL